ncbi:MAG: hypothetical protein J6C46_12665 [Clostridia bacterium]|nr:hypothetical protein [Clostridia bacterium]
MLSKKLKEQKGVSIIMLIVAIAMMAIVVSFAVFNSKDTTLEAKLASAYSSVKAVKDACDNAEMLIELNPNEYDEFYFFGHNLEYKLTEAERDDYATRCNLSGSTDFSERTYIIKPADSEDEEALKEEKNILENLEIKGISYTYVVDLEKEKYYILDGVLGLGGNRVHEYTDIIKEYELIVGKN